jgi:hypothetical protein
VDHTFEDFMTRVGDSGAEYYYIMRDGVWYVGSVYDVNGLVAGDLVSLSKALVWEAIAQ